MFKEKSICINKVGILFRFTQIFAWSLDQKTIIEMSLKICRMWISKMGAWIPLIVWWQTSQWSILWPFSFEDGTKLLGQWQGNLLLLLLVTVLLSVVLLAKVLAVLLMIHWGPLDNVALKDVDVWDYDDDYEDFVASQISLTLDCQVSSWLNYGMKGK